MLNLQKFAARIAEVQRAYVTPCWEWQGSIKTDSGYGRYRTRVNGKQVPEYAHRFSYTVFNGPIPANMVIDHLCQNRKCTNPQHLQAITNEENVRLGHTGHAGIYSPMAGYFNSAVVTARMLV